MNRVACCCSWVATDVVVFRSEQAICGWRLTTNESIETLCGWWTLRVLSGLLRAGALIGAILESLFAKSVQGQLG